MRPALGTRLLATNVLWNLIGLGIPLVVAVVAIPPLFRSLGSDRFGLLSLAWVLAGYFSIFDLGIGRALTQMVARSLGNEAEGSSVAGVVWTSLALLFGLGMFGAAALALGSTWAIQHLLRMPVALVGEANSAFLLISLAMPFVLTTTGLRGLLEARQAFALSNAIRIPLGMLTYIGPLAVLPLTHRVDALCASLLALRIAVWIAYLVACLATTPELTRRVTMSRSAIRSLLALSGWMALTNLVSPLMTYLDRFVIGAMISVGAVAYYTTPFEVVTRLFIISAAVTAVMFPAFATSYVANPHRTRLLFLRSAKYVALVMFPITLTFVSLAHPGLELWLGSTFSERSTEVLQWLAIGVLFNAMGQVAFVLVQGLGYPRLTGLLNLIELPIYLLCLWAFVRANGIDGAALAWTLRTGFDAAVLLLISARLLAIARWRLLRAALPTLVATLMLVVGAHEMPLPARVVLLTVSLIGFGGLAWFRVLTGEERAAGRRLLFAA